jgi:hypothetical protein
MPPHERSWQFIRIPLEFSRIGILLLPGKLHCYSYGCYITKGLLSGGGSRLLVVGTGSSSRALGALVTCYC